MNIYFNKRLDIYLLSTKELYFSFGTIKKLGSIYLLQHCYHSELFQSKNSVRGILKLLTQHKTTKKSFLHYPHQ